MSSSRKFDTKVLRGVEVRADPAREACFTVVHTHDDVPDAGAIGDEAHRQRTHRNYNAEVQALELAALCLVDYPDAPWELRMHFARQCWDEGRHAALEMRYLRSLGGWKGMYPISNLDWSVVGMLDSLAARLAVQNRTFEAGSLDLGNLAISLFHKQGRDEQAEVIDGMEADEIQHVRYGNEWLRRLTDAQPRAVLEIAQAMAWLQKVVDATQRATSKDIPPDDH